MRVVFVAPFFREATLRFVDAVANVPGVQVILVSQDQLEQVPPGIRAKLLGHFQVGNALDAGQLADGISKVQKHFGQIDRLLGALEHVQIQLGQVRDWLNIPGHGEAIARNFRDKARMKTVLQQAGIPCARHAEVLSVEAARKFAGIIGFPLVIKPREGAAAVSTWRVTNEAELNSALAAATPSPQNPCVIEEFMTGRERSFETFSLGGEPLWHSMTRYEPSPLTVLENPWIQWTVLLPREVDTPDMDAIRGPGRAAIKALGMQTGLSHMEWFWRHDGSVAISEVAARPPGAQILALNSYAHEADFYRLWAELVTIGQFTPPERKYAAGVAFFRGQGHGKVVAVEGLEAAQRKVGQWVVEAKLPYVGQWSSPSYEGEGFAIVKHPDTAVVEEALQVLVSTVQIRFGA